MTTKRKPPIPMKGPEKLSPEVIRDIVENRAMPRAGTILPKKHGISSERVKNIWGMYYGGTTLEDYKTGLKKELPTTEIPQTSFNRRVVKTEHGIYEVKEPKSMKQATRLDAGKRAVSIRKIPARKVERDLNLENIEEINDTDAQIIAGEVDAGNNSSELLAAIEQLVLHNQNISERTLSALEKALESANRRRRRYHDASDTDYSVATDIEETEDETEDDSTAVGRPQTRQRPQRPTEVLGRKGSEVVEEVLEPSSTVYCGNSGVVVQNQYPMGIHEVPVRGLDRHNQLGQSIREGAPRHHPGAQPVYRTVREWDNIGTDEEQSNNNPPCRYEQTLPTTQYYPSQGRVQSSNGDHNDQQHTSSGQSIGVHSGSRTGPGKLVPGHPWLKQRF